MRYLKKFNESATFLTDREEISGILGDLGVKRYEIEVDGTVNILNGGSIEMVFDGIDWTKIDREFDDTVIPIKFGRVEGYFLFKAENIYRPTLTSLEGFPQACRSFHIISAQITDLQGSPLMVDEDFECSFTSITSLKGCPKNINGSFDVTANKLRDFREGPDYVGGDYIATFNPLTSLEGLPKTIGGSLNINSPLLWDPTPLRDIEIGNILFCPNTKFDSIIELFHVLHGEKKYPAAHVQNKPYQTFLESLDYNYIRGDVDNPKIDLFRFSEALSEFGLDLDRLRLYRRSIGPYEYVDLDGNRVDSLGEKI